METQSSINQRVANHVRRLRGQLGLSLEALAGTSGVSRSMISLIERGEASSTAVVLERLATALGIPLAQLFDTSVTFDPAAPVSRRGRQPQWRDPASGYIRRNVSPPSASAPFRIVEVEFPAGGRVAFETTVHQPTMHQQVWVLKGRINVTVGENIHELVRGDCLAMQLQQPIIFANPNNKPARYAVVIGAHPLAISSSL